MDYLQECKIKVLLNKIVSLPCTIPVWVEDLKFVIHIEEKKVDSKQNNSWEKKKVKDLQDFQLGCRERSCWRKNMMTSFIEF